MQKFLAWRRLTAMLLASAGLLVAAPKLFGQAVEMNLMPLPSRIAPGEGKFIVDGNFDVKLEGYSEPRLELARKRMLAILTNETGIPFLEQRLPHPIAFTITTQGPSQAVQQPGEDESYHLEILSDRIKLTAPNPLGVLHGLQTFLQLVHITPQGFAAPVVTIDDEPRFVWRGLMIDSSRHFTPIDVIERNIDGMEAVKLNVFHWHLSDNQGFRVESHDLPLLHRKGSGGLYYTQNQIRNVVEYARDRGIRVVPEFDMPCHTTAWFVGYPELASAPGPYQIETKWGVFDPAMDPTREATFKFLDRFIGEMTALFPDPYFHIGGDECNGKQWDANAQIQAFMHAHGMKDDAALQSYFTGRVQKLVAAHHKVMMGWDEVLQPDTPRGVVIQSWRGPAALAAAARQGNRGILSNGYYIDLNEPAAQHYQADPLGGDAASLDAEQKKLVLGGEATMWSEFVTPETIDSRIWPRTAAIAERLWSPQNVRDVDSMYARMAMESQRLEYYGLKHQESMRAMLRRMSGEADPKELQVLADALQPPQEYTRGSLANYDVHTPLNHMVDAVPPESEVARSFKVLVEAIVAGHATPDQFAQARNWLMLWRDNDARLEPSLQRSSITAELAPVSKDLSQVATIGLASLDKLQNHAPAGHAGSDAAQGFLKQAMKPQAAVLDMVAPSVQLLVNAAAGSAAQ